MIQKPFLEAQSNKLKSLINLLESSFKSWKLLSMPANWQILDEY